MDPDSGNQGAFYAGLKTVGFRESAQSIQLGHPQKRLNSKVTDGLVTLLDNNRTAQDCRWTCDSAAQDNGEQHIVTVRRSTGLTGQ